MMFRSQLLNSLPTAFLYCITSISYGLLFLPAMVFANEVDVIDVKTQCRDTCVFYVTVTHHDEGWDHYVNKWEVMVPGGDVIATRKLLHPHVGEQPFTRSLSNIKIPEGIKKVVVRAHDSVHGYGGKMMEVEVGNDQK